MKKLTVLVWSLALAGCAGWQRDVTIGGITFTEARVEQSGIVIGRLPRETKIGHRLCQRGWVHVHPNGVVAAFAAAEPVPLDTFTIPRDTWIFQDERGTITVCAFPYPVEVDGNACRGTGGPKGVQTAFYPSGALRQFFPVRDVTIDGVSCHAGAIDGWVELHENGRLKSCLLGEEITRNGRELPSGVRIEFDAAGGVIFPPRGA